MVQIVICRSLFTLNVILNLVLYAVNINDIHVCVCFFSQKYNCQKPDFLKVVFIIIIIIYLFIYFFIRQSVIVFQEIGKNPKKKRNGEREKEEDRYIS